MIFTAYELHHDQADYEGYLRLMPLHAAFVASQSRPTLTFWCLLGLQDITYWHAFRQDILRMLAVNVHVRPPTRMLLRRREAKERE